MEIKLITNPADVTEIAQKLASAQFLAFDTEFIRESTFYPRLEILQIATPDEAWVLDCQVLKKNDLKPILKIFTDPGILKIVHAAHGDQECLLSAYDLLAYPLFDTAVGASLCGLGDHIGLSNLIRTVLNIELPKGYARTNWSKRPLPQAVLEYAVLDVKHLIEVSQILFQRLDLSGRRSWALELSNKFSDRKLYETPPEDLARRLAQSGKFHARDFFVLLELVRWREARVRELNIPRRWLAEDGVLIDLAKVKPKSLEQLQGFRGLSKGEMKAPHGDRILGAIQKGIDSNEELPADIKRREIAQPNQDESLGLELLRVCLLRLASDYQISAKHIVQPAHVLPLLRLKAASVELLAQSGLVSKELGEEGTNRLFQFLSGAVGLKLSPKHNVQFDS